MRRLPELFCGFQRSRGRGPTHYPGACSPQAWGSATPFTFIEASLGLQFDPVANQLRLRNPRLPSFLDELVLRNLQLKQSSVDLKVGRHANEVSVEILERRGQVQVAVVFGQTPDPLARVGDDVLWFDPRWAAACTTEARRSRHAEGAQLDRGRRRMPSSALSMAARFPC